MEEDNRNAYSEVIEILKFLDDEEKLEALPIEMLEVLKSKANPEYKPQISKDIPLDEQNLQPETLSILAWIASKYWGSELEKIDSNEIKEDENKIENISNDDNEIEKMEPEENQETTNNEESSNLPILHKDLKWYEKIKEKIIEFFDKIFHRKKKEGNTL